MILNWPSRLLEYFLNFFLNSRLQNSQICRTVWTQKQYILACTQKEICKYTNVRNKATYVFDTLCVKYSNWASEGGSKPTCTDNDKMVFRVQTHMCARRHVVEMAMTKIRCWLIGIHIFGSCEDFFSSGSLEWNCRQGKGWFQLHFRSDRECRQIRNVLGRLVFVYSVEPLRTSKSPLSAGVKKGMDCSRPDSLGHGKISLPSLDHVESTVYELHWYCFKTCLSQSLDYNFFHWVVGTSFRTEWAFKHSWIKYT